MVKGHVFCASLEETKKRIKKVVSLLQHGIYMQERGRYRGRLDASAMKRRSNHSEI